MSKQPIILTKKVAVGNLFNEEINNLPTPRRRALPKPPPTNTRAISFIKNKDNLIQINNYDGSEIKDKIFESKNGINKIKMNEIREINSENINESEKYNKITNNNLEIRISEASQLNHKKFKIKLEEINKKYGKMPINPQKDLLQIKEDSPLALRESSSLEIISCESDIKSSKIEEKIVVINQEINQNYSKEKIEKI